VKHFAYWKELSVIWSNMCIFLHVKCRNFCHTFMKLKFFLTEFLKTPKYQISQKIRPAAAELFRVDGRKEGRKEGQSYRHSDRQTSRQAGRHHKANRRLAKLLARLRNLSHTMLSSANLTGTGLGFYLFFLVDRRTTIRLSQSTVIFYYSLIIQCLVCNITWPITGTN